jgi:nicotinamidase-related amidase
MKFPLTSEQCELLAAFEGAASLAALATVVRRDVSVVSRQLAALAAAAPVLEKSGGRWRITAFGRQINNLSRAMIAAQRKILEQHGPLRLAGARLPTPASEAALLMIGVQTGWDDPAWGARNQPQAEERIAAVAAAWRASGRPVIHCRHASTHVGSPLRAGSAGSDFKPEGRPLAEERVFTKSVNSAFVGTDLDAHLKAIGCRALVLVGFSTNHCVDATARSAGDLGYQAFVVADATACFDRVAWDGRLLKAEELHTAALVSLNLEFATVVESADLVAHLSQTASVEA